MANTKIIEGKKKQVKELTAKIKESQVLLLTNYRGINVEDVTKLRSDLREVGAEYAVIKNNIVKRALHEIGITDLDDKLVGPTAVITSTVDYLAPSKIIYKFMESKDFYELKGGMIEGEVKEADEIITIAKLPSREELLGKLAGVLLANISKLAVALDQVREKKESGVEVTEKTEEAVVEETEETEVKEEKSEEKVEDAKEEKVEEETKTTEETKEEEK